MRDGWATTCLGFVEDSSFVEVINNKVKDFFCSCSAFLQGTEVFIGDMNSVSLDTQDLLISEVDIEELWSKRSISFSLILRDEGMQVSSAFAELIEHVE